MLKNILLNDKIILILILLNAVIIFLSGFSFQNNILKYLIIADNIITILFVIESIVKINTFGSTKYFSSNWNRFDFILIIFSIPSLILFLLNFDQLNISFLLSFRVLRVFKSFRFLKFIPGVGNLIVGVQRALRASLIVMFGLLIYIFLIGILSFYIFNESANEYFSNPLISLFTIFRIFTIEGWYEIPTFITKNYSSFQTFLTYIYFIFVLLSGGIFGLSLVNSIFVDAMVSDNNDELEKKIESLEIKIDELLKIEKERSDINQ